MNTYSSDHTRIHQIFRITLMSLFIMSTKKNTHIIHYFITFIAHSSFQGKAFGPSRLAWMHLILWPFTISSSFSPILNFMCLFIGFFMCPYKGCIVCIVGLGSCWPLLGGAGLGSWYGLLASYRYAWIIDRAWLCCNLLACCGHINLGQS